MSRYVVFAVLALFGKCAAKYPFYSAAQHRAVAKFMLSKEISTVSEETSSECFDLYTPQLDKTAEKWLQSYNACIKKAGDDRNAFMTQIKQNKIDILQSSNKIIMKIYNCQKFRNPMDFFNCFSGLNQNILSRINTISNTASVDAALLNKQLNGINDNRYLCTNSTDNAFVEQVTAINIALNNCLKYGLAATEETKNRGVMFITNATEDSSRHVKSNTVDE